MAAESFNIPGKKDRYGNPVGDWICVIGGGYSQASFITSAYRMGLRTIVFDRNPDAPGIDIATHFEVCSTHDTEEILRLCDKILGSEKLIGCLTYSSDKQALMSTAAVVEKYNLPGITTDIVNRTTSKQLWKPILEEAGISTPSWQQVNAEDSLDSLLSEYDKIILKPASVSGGSSGVSLIDLNTHDPGKLLRKACNASQDGIALAENWHEGTEYSVDGYVRLGNCKVLGVSPKYVRRLKGDFITEGYVYGGASSEVERELTKVAQEVVKALKLNNTFFSLDVIVSDGESWVVDLGPLLDAKMDRLLWFAGNSIYELAVRLVLTKEGIISNSAYVSQASEDELQSIRSNSDNSSLQNLKSCALRFVYASKEGRVRDDGPIHHYRTLENGEKFKFTFEMEKRDGDLVTPPQSVADVVGWILHCGSPKNKAWERVKKIDDNELFSLE